MVLEAVIFDMDGVLCETDEHHYQSWKSVCDEFDVPFSRELNDRLRGLTRRRSLQVILKNRQLSQEDKDEFLRRKNRYFLQSVENMGPRDLSAGVARLLQEIRLAGIKIGVASASRNVTPVLDRLGIDGFFDAVSDGNLVERSKPAPDVFLRTAAALNVEASRCLVIEDSQAGIQAAIAARMAVIGIGPADRVGAADAVLENLSKVHLGDLKAVYSACSSVRKRKDSLQISSAKWIPTQSKFHLPLDS
jgi:beta-phosphoglucomutase